MTDKEKIENLTSLVVRMGNEINRLKNALNQINGYVAYNNLPHQLNQNRDYVMNKSRIALQGGEDCYTWWELQTMCEDKFGQDYWLKGVEHSYHY